MLAPSSAARARAERIKVSSPQTNILYVDLPPAACAGLAEALARARIRVTMAPHMRIVTHLDVSIADVRRCADVFAAYFNNGQSR